MFEIHVLFDKGFQKISSFKKQFTYLGVQFFYNYDYRIP